MSNVRPDDLTDVFRPPLRPADLNDVVVWRLEVMFHTCDLTNAGTDDFVYVQFRKAAASRFFLDYGRNDFMRNATDSFDINPQMAGVRTLRDIETFTIGKVRYATNVTTGVSAVGTDGWCFNHVSIRVNQSHELIFEKTSTDGWWLDGDDGHKPTTSFAHSEFKPLTTTNVGVSPKIVLSYSDVEHVIEGTVGHINATNDLNWGKKAGAKWVDVAEAHGGSWSFDLDLALDSWWFDSEVDVDGSLFLERTPSGPMLKTRWTSVADGELPNNPSISKVPFEIAEKLSSNPFRISQHKYTFEKTWITFPPVLPCVRFGMEWVDNSHQQIVIDNSLCLN